MFASQAAMVIANARRHREERRARTDLETLVDTSPVGVVVFDAGTGAPVSFNREATRIVDGLRDEDQSPEQLLDVLTFRRSDGREVSLEEFSLVEALSAGETVRAEELVLRVPDGRSVTVLLNATPIPSEGGGIASYVVTLQDLAPLEEQERLRAEFLAMVSHELRTPLAAVKGSADTLLEADLDPAEMRQFHQIIRDQSDSMRELIGDLLDVARIETGTLSVRPAIANVAEMVDEARGRFLDGNGREGPQIELRAQPAPRNGRPAAHRPGAGQPAHKRGDELAGGFAHQGERHARGRACRGVRRRRGEGHPRRAAAAPVQEVPSAGGRGPGKRHRRLWPGSRHLQGHRGCARWTHLGRE